MLIECLIGVFVLNMGVSDIECLKEFGNCLKGKVIG